MLSQEITAGQVSDELPRHTPGFAPMRSGPELGLLCKCLPPFSDAQTP